MTPDKIYLVGFMASGKSTVARAMGHRLGWRSEDIDELIEADDSGVERSETILHTDVVERTPRVARGRIDAEDIDQIVLVSATRTRRIGDRVEHE